MENSSRINEVIARLNTAIDQLIAGELTPVEYLEIVDKQEAE